MEERTKRWADRAYQRGARAGGADAWGDGEEKSYRENVELAKDLGGFLFGDLLFSAESKWALSERFQTDRECSFPMDTRARSEPEKTVGARGMKIMFGRLLSGSDLTVA